jgi:heat shock protein HslJ
MTIAQVMIPNLDSTTLYSYEWYLFKMPNANLSRVDNSSLPNLLFSPVANGQFSGSAECNEVEGRIKLSERNKIQFTDIAEEEYECNHDLDEKFIKMLQKVDHYKIQDHQLKLYRKNGLPLAKFYAEVTHLSYYKMTGLEGDWIQNLLAKPGGWVDVNLLDTVPIITFNKTSPGKITGFTGCNSFSGLFTLENYQIRFSEINNINENDCDSEAEKYFINNLSMTTMFWVTNDLLAFWNGQSLVMDF